MHCTPINDCSPMVPPRRARSPLTNACVRMFTGESLVQQRPFAFFRADASAGKECSQHKSRAAGSHVRPATKSQNRQILTI